MTNPKNQGLTALSNIRIGLADLQEARVEILEIVATPEADQVITEKTINTIVAELQVLKFLVRDLDELSEKIADQFQVRTSRPKTKITFVTPPPERI